MADASPGATVRHDSHNPYPIMFSNELNSGLSCPRSSHNQWAAGTRSFVTPMASGEPLQSGKAGPRSASDTIEDQPMAQDVPIQIDGIVRLACDPASDPGECVAQSADERSEHSNGYAYPSRYTRPLRAARLQTDECRHVEYPLHDENCEHPMGKTRDIW